MPKVLMVCLGNICRSPMAEAVANHFAKIDSRRGVSFESAGTCPVPSADADARARSTLQSRGYALPKRRARNVVGKDFERFDLILAMDSSCLAELQRRCPAQHQSKVRLFMSLAEPRLVPWPVDVPDPYYGNSQGFEKVLDLCEAGVKGLLKFDFRTGSESDR